MSLNSNFEYAFLQWNFRRSYLIKLKMLFILQYLTLSD